FRRLFFGKRIGTVSKAYWTVTKWKALKRYKLQTRRSIERFDAVSFQPFDLVSFCIRRSVSLSHAEPEGLRHTAFDLFSRDSVRIALAVQHCFQGTGPIQPAGRKGKSRELEIFTHWRSHRGSWESADRHPLQTFHS